jgi:hypothetical protein
MWLRSHVHSFTPDENEVPNHNERTDLGSVEEMNFPKCRDADRRSTGAHVVRRRTNLVVRDTSDTARLSFEI